MLGTHSQLRRGQISYICDISLLRVKQCIRLLCFIITVSGYEETANLGIEKPDPVIFLLESYHNHPNPIVNSLLIDSSNHTHL